ncbi:hypothetical protein [Paenibacillus lutimineralis]|uniref:Uncharacterized protein n=1 Tax=Paenibacillus lutimineralis TaxID=2707005 RepID=A0A3Q9I7F1_9BACL|nr:hypothetical protein [Paenibacillus lutimineralis]AZS14407.1 hypothetical protein EI981_08030 [Paenibacillus lutimineralis]
MKLRACHYDDNRDTSTVIDADGKTYRFNCSEIENVLVMHAAARNGSPFIFKTRHMHRRCQRNYDARRLNDALSGEANKVEDAVKPPKRKDG